MTEITKKMNAGVHNERTLLMTESIGYIKNVLYNNEVK